MAEAEVLVVLALDFVLSAFIASLDDFVASPAEGFIASPEGDEGEEAAGGELKLEPDGDDEYCASADESISPLSAVVTNSFFSIGNLHAYLSGYLVRPGRGFSCAVLGKTGPLHTNV